MIVLSKGYKSQTEVIPNGQAMIELDYNPKIRLILVITHWYK